MRIAFNIDPKASGKWNHLEYTSVQAFIEGTKRCKPDHHVICDPNISDPSKYDMIGIFGVKSRKIIHECQEKNVPFIYFDKAYNRDKRWWKISINAHHPTRFLTILRKPDDRRKVQGWEPKSWRKPTDRGHILIAGSSMKYHMLYRLPDPTSYWTEVVKQLREHTSRKILYRPKKSWHDAVPIEGTEFSKAEKIEDDLKGAHCMITHGSNSCIEAILAGIPAIVLGEGITAPISSHLITKGTVSAPYECPDSSKDLILNNLAYFQWSIDELKTGIFWRTFDDCFSIQEIL